jgi:hypothetical protein
MTSHVVDPDINDKVGDRFSTLTPDFTFRVSCITEEHNLETALMAGFPNHPFLWSTE